MIRRPCAALQLDKLKDYFRNIGIEQISNKLRNFVSQLICF